MKVNLPLIKQIIAFYLHFYLSFPQRYGLPVIAVGQEFRLKYLL